ncbi:alpha/beta hydrolase [Actinoplanes sp. NEAU-A12]|uniref:Alpha/beta hydrolase n=1 Tax=Actinoplanes sandaracinus TaxID=3045177 RepID=A0ABT6WFP4_9ACTN|nr:alpha/beta hydrolase [Actinoplanes sandaracinus]MDI6098508.1 alpha/beta hydrolase [Actinoplanes sandaracinus]
MNGAAVSATAVTYARLRSTDPARWRVTALAWRRWAALAGAFCAEFGPLLARLRDSWSGAAAEAAAARLNALRRRMAWFRVICWRADQALSEFAAALARARALLDRAHTAAGRAGLVIDDSGAVRGPAGEHDAIRSVGAELGSALTVAAEADASAAARLGALADVPPAPVVTSFPACTATPAEVRRWWEQWTPAERDWLLATEPAALAGADGIPVADRDVANRLLLDDHRLELDRMRAVGADPDRIRDLLEGLDRLTARLDDETGPRAYLVGLGLDGEGRAVVALGDPDRAAHVLTHVPGMTSDLKSLGGELSRAERVAARAGELGPGGSTSAVLWLDYDAPDFVHEAASARQARDGAPELTRFQEALRATHDGEPAHQTVLGHSYGSLVVGRAAAAGGLPADDVVFVGSPGVGVDSASQLRIPADRVWSTTSITDPIRLAARPDPGLPDRSRDLWFGRDPSEPGFGARVFRSQLDAGHLGYWDAGKPALDALARITLGGAP